MVSRYPLAITNDVFSMLEILSHRKEEDKKFHEKTIEDYR